jgi:hypothetical protein
MIDEVEIWKPGSFTKNFSWGNSSSGLVELYEIIKLGFAGAMEDVPRALFRERIESAGRPVYIPMNFFLFNKVVDGVDYLCADELVFQAVNWPHSPRFDKLALFAFNLSLAGRWTGARKEQRRPALWANAYMRKRVASDFDWDTRRVNAGDIERFVGGDPRYHAKTSGKLGTNLAYMFLAAKISEFPSKKVERWWVDCLFLALDRITEDRLLDGKQTQPQQYGSLLNHYGFLELTGKPSLEKELAVQHLTTLYSACGGLNRFSEEATRERINVLLPQLVYFAVNDHRPRGAVHLTNPRILKSIPAACAMLAKYAGFDDLSPDELEEFDLEEFVKRRTYEALANLKDRDIRPTMTAEEIMKLTRDR